MSGSRSPRLSQDALNIIEAGRMRRSHNQTENHYTPFSHIQVRPFPVHVDADESYRYGSYQDEGDVVVRRGSIQDQLKYIAPSTPVSSNSSSIQIHKAVHIPNSFAEAVVMSRSGPGRGDNRDASADAALELSSSLPSSKTTLRNSKKAKKWAPLDLAIAETGTGANTSPATPAPSIITTGSTAESLLSPSPSQDSSLEPPLPSPEASAYISPRSATSQAHDLEDLDQTPTQAAFNATFARLAVVAPINSPDRSIFHKQDSESTKHKLHNIMSRIDDAFDVEDWSPSLATTDLDNSPEPLTVKPQPVTYTTVGSLVKSNAAPQFTAPVRIQREGACRRPPPTPIQVRGHENLMGVRGTTPQHSMAYNAPAQSPYRPQTLSQLQQTRTSTGMSDADRATLQKLGVNTPTLRSGNVPSLAQNANPKVDPFVSSSSEVSNAVALMKEDNIDQSTLGSTAKSALDKMQTLLGLSQYQNPMQQFAKERLAEFAATKIQAPIPTAMLPAPQQSAPTNPFLPRNPMAYGQTENDLQRKGQLEVEYRYPQFPPPGLVPPSTVDHMRRGNDLRLHSQHGPQMSSSQQYNSLSGRPQPLQAGPPGQRQLTMGNNMPRLNSLQGGLAGGNLPIAHPAPKLLLNSPWLAHNRQNMFTSIPTKTSQIRDTISPADATKYYPNGLPPDTTGSFIPFSVKTDEQKRIDTLDNWWSGGVRRSNMTRSDYVSELEQRERELKSGSRAQPFHSLPIHSTQTNLSVGQVKEMSEADCAAPLLDSVFGSLLGYADRIITPTNKSLLSNFEQPSPHLIDNGPRGNDSLFGEDWGVPQNRVIHDPKQNLSKI